MLNIILFFINLIEQQTLWIYALCALLILWQLRAYLLARRDRYNTIFTIEREVAAHREGRAMSSIGALLGLVLVVTALKYYVVPSLDVEELVEPTPTLTLIVPTREPTATPTPDVSPTATRRPTSAPTNVLPTHTPVVATPVPQAAACPDGDVRITSPGLNAVVSGWIQIWGSADNARFQFYKVEIGIGENPSGWTSISDVHRAPMRDGVLDEFDTASVPNGVYWFKLTVVDQTGNFPEPCAVRVTVRN